METVNAPMMKKGGFNMLFMLILFGMIPLVISAFVMTLASGTKMKNEVQDSTVTELEIANRQFNAMATDWYNKYGEDYFTKEDKDYSYVDSYQDMGVEFTVFLGDTRMMTSLKDSSGKRIEGTQASEGVISACLKGGAHYQSDGVSINNKSYYVDYLPLKDADGNIVGMTFAGKTNANVTKSVFAAVFSLVIIAVIAVIIFAALIVVLALKVRAPLVELADALNAFAAGNLSMDITTTSIVTENKNMITSLKYMQYNIQNLIAGIQQEAGNLASGVVTVEKLSDESANSTGQISNAMNELSNGAMSMAENVNDISAQMIDMGEMVQEIQDNVSGLTDNAQKMNDVSGEASDYMEKVMASSTETVSAVDQINDQILRTNDSINKINSAIDLIIEIASQTNLLALNATIEAARAGEAGRGFAVVADNISNLSEQSNASAAQIREIAEEILRNSSASVSLASRIKNTIEEEQGVIQETREKFDLLNASIGESVEEINMIGEKTHALEGIKDNLVANVSDLSAISEENAANNEEVLASVETISMSIDEIADHMTNMNQMSQNLEDSVAHFS